MPFNSFSYAFFLPVVWLISHHLGDRFRWQILLVASYGFYASLRSPPLLLALALVTVISYLGALGLQGKRRGRVLGASILSLVLLLAALKCLALANVQVMGQGMLVSIGVSYFTLQAVSYLIDVYWEVLEPERHLGYYALSVAFFPKLLQGPIERSGRLLPQLKKSYHVDYHDMRSGLLLFTWGLFKKAVLADRFALYANAVYQDVYSYTGLPLILATYAFALQLYFDFAGYTDMARGTARMFGIDLSENFDSPYFATSIADFWRRWHISFSSWLSDYLFKPLHMSWRYLGRTGTSLAIVVTFLISGIWHGVSWGFVVWGGLHGLFLACSVWYRPWQKRLQKRVGPSDWYRWWQIAVTFNLVAFAWIFFRAGTLRDAWYVVLHLFDFGGSYALAHRYGMADFLRTNILLGLGRYEFMTVLVLLAVLFWARRKKGVSITSYPLWSRWLLYYTLFFSIWFLGSVSSDFFYFKF